MKINSTQKTVFCYICLCFVIKMPSIASLVEILDWRNLFHNTYVQKVYENCENQTNKNPLSKTSKYEVSMHHFQENTSVPTCFCSFCNRGKTHRAPYHHTDINVNLHSKSVSGNSSCPSCISIVQTETISPRG